MLHINCLLGRQPSYFTSYVNNANATEDKNHAIIYKMAIVYRIYPIAEWNVLFICKINIRIKK